MRIIAFMLLTACNATPAAMTVPNPPPSPMATATPQSVQPAPVAAPATFGAIQAKRLIASVRQQIGTDGIDPLTQNAGTATSRYVTVDGLEYAIHWDDAQRFDDLTIGATVNLHPTRDRVCFGDADCRRLFHVYPGNRFIPPLQIAP